MLTVGIHHKWYVGLSYTTPDGDVVRLCRKHALGVVARAMSEHLKCDCYTVTDAVGYFRGVEEPTLIVHMIAGVLDQGRLAAFNEQVRFLLAQQCILYTTSPVHMTYHT